MKTHLSIRIARMSSGLALLLLLSCFPVVARQHTRRAHARRQPIPTHTIAFLNGPINAQPFWCDFERKTDNVRGMAAATVKFTRTLPQNGWVATVHYEYAAGNKLDQEFQIFNPRQSYSQPKTPATPKRLLGTNWDFQLTNGAVSCQLFVSSSSGEMRFSKCTNGIEQYCTSRRLHEVIRDKKFPSCVSGTIIDQALCLDKGVGSHTGLTSLANDPVCEQHPVACMTILLDRITPITLEEFMTHDHFDDAFVIKVLEAMRQDWLDFTNGALGGCESSHVCPGGTYCSQGSCQKLFSY